jgi:hypothetical protein
MLNATSSRRKITMGNELELFDRYYDTFLQNALRGRRFKITLLSGESAEGVPTASSIADPGDPNASFPFLADDGKSYQIRFADLQHVAPAVGAPNRP